MTTPYCPFPNQFRADIRSGKTVIGCWASLASPITTEILGLAGFDWILLDAEHSPNDVLSLVPQLMALKDSASAPVVRPPWNEPVILKRLLDIGFHNFLIPYIETVEEAERAVASTRYPPQGFRGVSIAQRSNNYGTLNPKGYFPAINDNITVLLQIETRKGVEAVDAIASVDGVDGLFVGPNDLAAAYGHLANPGHPEVQAVIRHVFDRARAAGKAAGILTGVEAEARRYLEWGATFVAVGSDLGLFRGATQALRDKFKAG
ncbi:2-dehydro-3-deoxyglucarate aldolase [Rhodoplanes sp. TEM]|uniref:2-dehydro-3-deoxyglucarate aldolase n=1 Tax=Rhodoplanes tepidamans TaxID=200616 RepID=A0ABT5J6P8_RHOTP|nr:MULTISPECIES: 2-dehydro-3-deoxyglucarate aldolase [Rhodoplanes]MDC7785334.1 2-dehydro-3-deoxyglucarate aldolase [Rhodoplanes tepidamans]MDC7986273.1 2-dehydro-3-deoxyglucarate aldolase [Rhodoplanes sp. TEM]MDQ0353215.1 2-dehydro-3-deoxyglucarate aldolase [Rhodoplanes tepidamans]